MLYLDNAATTPLLPEVKEAMLPYLSEIFGNPNSKYYVSAIASKEAVQNAREQIAKLVNCQMNEVIFTSGTTESNNFILKGLTDPLIIKDKAHIITSKIEHPSILEVCKYLEQIGHEVTYLDVDQNGRINIDSFKKAIQKNTRVVSIQWVNNEIGSIQPIKEIAKISNEKNIFFHVDATQALGKLKIDFNNISGLSALSISAHKCFGPKGVGALILKRDTYNQFPHIQPLLHGGGQEYGLRSGTLAVHNIVGFGKACEIAYNHFAKNLKNLNLLEKKLESILNEKFKNHISFNHPAQNKAPGILSVRFKNINNEVLAKKLSGIIATSTGSACSSSTPSYVLQAISLDIQSVRETLRFSLSPYTKLEELDIFSQL